ncbi:hypothetical protein GOODEAATRI_030106 [Goodea atripinnis]|uniref:Uncharacterized protein n=1 Tax=Goodea atripinnis TaxID=208336 RepID=A0ABV0PIE2_9TELE
MDSCYKISNPKQDESSGSGPGSSLSRPPSACSSVLSLLKGNPELPPFSVEPRIGTINPGATQNFSVCFSPVEVAQFQGRLLCSIPNLQDGDQAPCITVSGQGLLPNVHFDLEDSDYIRSNRLSPKFSRLLDPSTPVLEFKAIGFSAPTRRSFNVVNPTRKAYDFKWRCEDTAASLFHCLTSFGTIPSGKKVEMCFEFVAEHQDTVESLWSFLIENLSLSFPFLCVGTAREPCVYLDRPHLDFGELVVGHKVEQTVDLVNAEEEPFQFSVLQLSLLSEDQQSSLTLKPMNGTVGISEQCTYNLLVSNLSRCILEVSFELTGDREHLQQLEVKPQAGPVEIGKQLQVSVFFCPQTVWNLQDVRLIVKAR